MKEKIQKILDLNNQVSNLDSMIFDKENDILSCIKSINEEGMRLRQKNAAISLLDLKKQKEEVQGELHELLKSLDSASFENKKATRELTINCIEKGIVGQDFSKLKTIYLNL